MIRLRYIGKLMEFNKLCVLMGFLAVMLACPAVTLAQSTFGSIVGTVHDPSGAVVAKCAVTIINTGTDSRRAILTDANGEYSAPNLEPGTYKITMEAPGFQPFTY